MILTLLFENGAVIEIDLVLIFHTAYFKLHLIILRTSVIVLNPAVDIFDVAFRKARVSKCYFLRCRGTDIGAACGRCIARGAAGCAARSRCVTGCVAACTACASRGRCVTRGAVARALIVPLALRLVLHNLTCRRIDMVFILHGSSLKLHLVDNRPLVAVQLDLLLCDLRSRHARMRQSHLERRAAADVAAGACLPRAGHCVGRDVSGGNQHRDLIDI